jgi:membrane-bound lytic murein transglycosylase A
MKTKILLAVSFTAVFILSSCKAPGPDKIQYDKPLPPGQLALRKITNPDDIPDFTIACCNNGNLRAAVENSLNYLSKPSSKQFFPYGRITHDHAVKSLNEFAGLLDSDLVGRQLNREIHNRFDVYTSVGCDDKGTVLFTGYYTPIFDGSLEQTGEFSYPLYSQPDDLVKDSFGQILGRKSVAGAISKYPSRRQIEESQMLAGSELVWLSNPFEVYIAHVQGSVKIRLPDGQLITMGYAASNGHEYHSVAKDIVAEGKIPAEQLSLDAMIAYFGDHPEDVAEYTNRNPRFVFFRVSDDEPRGSLNEPVIARRSVATDKSIYPRGCLTFMQTKMPRLHQGEISIRSFTGFALDQDTGGAIRAPGRCDIYMGQGETAGRLAGKIYQPGRFYYLFLKL